MRATCLLLSLMACAGLPACGGGDDCEPTMTLLCDKACACTSGEGCNVGDGQGAVLFNDSRQDCLDWYVGIGCSYNPGSGPPNSYFEACAAALATAECTTEGEEALIVPADCIYEGD